MLLKRWEVSVYNKLYSNIVTGQVHMPFCPIIAYPSLLPEKILSASWLLYCTLALLFINKLIALLLYCCAWVWCVSFIMNEWKPYPEYESSVQVLCRTYDYAELDGNLHRLLRVTLVYFSDYRERWKEDLEPNDDSLRELMGRTFGQTLAIPSSNKNLFWQFLSSVIHFDTFF